MKKILLLLFLIIPNLVLASEWKGDWCGNEYGRVLKCFWDNEKGMLTIPDEVNVIANIFPDAPIMVKVAEAESGGKQFNDDGSVVENKVTHDYGLFQINRMHIPEALKRGYDIFTLEGNAQMARALYDEQGLSPWSASEGKWSK